MALLPVDPRARRVCWATLANTFGNGLWMTSLALFLTRFSGLSARAVGLALTISIFVGIAAGIPVGRVADVRDVRLLRALAQLTQAATVLPLLLVHSFAALLPLLCVEALASTANQVLRGALVAAVAGRGGRVELWATMRAVANVGKALGSLTAGLLIAVGTRGAYAAMPVLDLLSFLASAGFLISVGPVRAEAETASAGGLGPLRNRRFVAVVVVTSVLLMGGELVAFPLPLWISDHTRAPDWFVSVVVTGVNIVGVALSGWSKRGDDAFGPSARRFRLGAGILGLGVAGFGLASLGGGWLAVALLLVATPVFGIGDLLVAVRGSAMAFALSPEGEIGAYQGMMTTGNSLAYACAPALFSAILLGPGVFGALEWVGLGCALSACGALAVLLTPGVRPGRRPPARRADRPGRTSAPAAR